MSEWISIKDTNGDRILDPERQKERIASYYENLYSFDPNLEGHSHHAYVKTKMEEYQSNRGHEDDELLKRGGQALVNCLYPVIQEFWAKEYTLEEWNRGLISSIYKGKGDREKLEFQRGITVSSSISMICEEIINQRMVKLIPFSSERP